MAVAAGPSDTIDLRDVWSALRRGWRWIVGGLILGVVLALLALVVLPRRYEGTASVLLRNSAAGGQGSPLSRLGSFADLIPGSVGSGVETELQILSSRSVIGEVVDSLGLQAVVVEPENIAPAALVARASYAPVIRDAEYRFERVEDGFVVRAEGMSPVRARPGQAVRLTGAVLVLRDGNLPDEFTLALRSRETAIDWLRENLQAEAEKGEVAELVFRAGDPILAAAVPNSLIAEYLTRRTTTDQGVNQRRHKFLSAQADSTVRELYLAEGALRRFQEQSGVVDPAARGEAELERLVELRGELETVDVEARALEQLVEQVEGGSSSARRLAAYPTFLNNPAMNSLLSRIIEQETVRQELLQRRTPRDPEVVAVSEKIRLLEGELASLARSYLTGLDRQRGALREELRGYREQMGTLPGQAEQSVRLARDVERLSQTLLGLQAQLVQSRLGAITEGGDVRQVDIAVPPEEPAFPKPLLTLAIGVFGGLLVGIVGALGGTYLSERVRDVRTAELAGGVPTITLSPRGPLLLGSVEGRRGVMIVPVGIGAETGEVADRFARTALLQGERVARVDVEGPGRALLPVSDRGTSVVLYDGSGMVTSLERVPAGDVPYPVFEGISDDEQRGGLRAAFDELAEHYTFVVTSAAGIEHPATAALLAKARPVVLVARAGKVTRAQLRDTVAALTQLGIPVPGLILQNGHHGDGSSVS